MRRHRAHLVILACLLAASDAAAGKPPEVGISVDPEPVTQGTPFQLSITVVTESQEDPTIQLPRLRGFEILRQSESHPMSFSFSFGFGSQAQRQVSRQSQYSFVLLARQPGRFTLDPVVVTVDKRQYRSEPRVIVVQPAGGAPAGPGPTPPPLPDPGATPPATGDSQLPGLAAQDLAGVRVDPDAFLQTWVSKRRVVAGEPLLMTVFLYATHRITNLDLIQEPGTEGFWTENLRPGDRRLEPIPVNVNGVTYDRSELRNLALFPIKAGRLTISPPVAEIETLRGGFFARGHRLTRAGQPVVVEVVEPPTAGRPAGFEKTNVGTYTFSAALDVSTVEVGQPAQLSLTVRGAGNLRGLALPRPPALDGLKIYDPESSVDVRPEAGGVSGLRTEKVLMIPTRPGTFTVPPLAFVWYDPASGRYETATSEALTFSATAAATGPVAGDPTPPAATGTSPPREAGGAISRLASRLGSIEVDADLNGRKAAPLLERPAFVLLLLAPPALWLLVVLLGRTRAGLAARDQRHRPRRAASSARRRIAELAARTTERNDVFFGELHRALTTYLDDRLETTVGGDTHAELKARLRERGFAAETSERVVAELEAWEFARFARVSGDTAERTAAAQAFNRLIDELEQTTPRPDPRRKG